MLKLGIKPLRRVTSALIKLLNKCSNRWANEEDLLVSFKLTLKLSHHLAVDKLLKSTLWYMLDVLLMRSFSH